MKKDTPMQCQELERLAVFYACDELEPDERAAVEEHAASCASCAATLSREQRLTEAVAARIPAEPSAVFLARCRGELADRLDDVVRAGYWQQFKEWVRPKTWFLLHPAWSAAFCILLGVSLGVLLPLWLQPKEEAPSSREIVRAPAVSPDDLRQLGVHRISQVPGSGGEPGFEVQVGSEEPIVLSGTVDNVDIRRILMYVMRNNQRFDSGLRLDSLEALRTRNDVAEIRKAFCQAARSDNNPGVRLKALEALRGFEQEEQVRKTLLDALLRDDNPGVRIEAINALRAVAESQKDELDPQILKVLRDRMQNDPNTYVRLQSAAVVRELGPRAQY